MSCVPPGTRTYIATAPGASQTSGTTQLRDMEEIPGGTFQMGGLDFPARTVYVNTFYMDKYMVTNAAYKKFVDANPEFWKVKSKFYLLGWNGNNYPPGKGNHPVLTWIGGLLWLTRSGLENVFQPKQSGRKPHAEASSVRNIRGNLQLNNVANLDFERTGKTTDVLTLSAEPYGLLRHDRKWC